MIELEEVPTELQLFESSGILRYRRGDNGSFSLRVEVDQGILEYYRALIPKWIRTNKPMYSAHVSVVRKEEPPNLEFWGKYEGVEVPFWYSNIVHSGTIYYWLNVFSVRLEEIRVELGLPVTSRYTEPPDGFRKCFHMTIANLKELNVSKKV